MIEKVRYICSDAWLSDDEVYRYVLLRQWAIGQRINYLTFMMLNPSTANWRNDDHTIRKCVGFAWMLGYDGIVVINLYAFRARDPKVMRQADDPVGPDNYKWVHEATRQAVHCETPVVAAWGSNMKGMDSHVADVMGHAETGTQWMCLGLTKDGQPRHPLMLPYSTRLEPFSLSS